MSMAFAEPETCRMGFSCRRLLTQGWIGSLLESVEMSAPAADAAGDEWVLLAEAAAVWTDDAAVAAGFDREFPNAGAGERPAVGC